MTFLLPHSRPRVTSEQQRAERRRVSVPRLGRVDLDAAEVLGADVAVLAGADQSGRRSMVAVERVAIEMLGDEHTISQRVLDRDDRPVAVEATEHHVRDGRVGCERWCDDAAIEDLERDSLPSQVGGRPAGHAVEVGVELSPGEGGQGGEWNVEGFGHRPADLDDGIDRDRRRGSGEVLTEARKTFDRALAGRKRHYRHPGRDCWADTRVSGWVVPLEGWISRTHIPFSRPMVGHRPMVSL